MERMRFETEIVPVGKMVGVALPFDPSEAWGQKSRYFLCGLIGGYKVRGSLIEDGGRFVLPIGATWPLENDFEVGDKVEVELALERLHVDEFADDIAAALRAEPEALSFFAGLAGFYQREYIKWIEGAKRPETRSRRVAQLIELLKAGKRER